MSPSVRRLVNCCVPVLAFAWSAAPGAAQPVANPVCLYQSKSYSEGAFICVQKSLMLACSADGTRAAWRVVADKDLGDRCVAPTHSAEPRKRIVRRARPVRHAVAPVEPASAKCFVFNGKRYCE